MTGERYFSDAFEQTKEQEKIGEKTFTLTINLLQMDQKRCYRRFYWQTQQNTHISKTYAKIAYSFTSRVDSSNWIDLWEKSVFFWITFWFQSWLQMITFFGEKHVYWIIILFFASIIMEGIIYTRKNTHTQIYTRRGSNLLIINCLNVLDLVNVGEFWKRKTHQTIKSFEKFAMALLDLIPFYDCII